MTYLYLLSYLEAVNSQFLNKEDLKAQVACLNVEVDSLVAEYNEEWDKVRLITVKG